MSAENRRLLGWPPVVREPKDAPKRVDPLLEAIGRARVALEAMAARGRAHRQRERVEALERDWSGC